MAHLEEVQVSTGFWASAKEKETTETTGTDKIPSGLYSDLEQSALMKVRQLKLQEFLGAKQRFDEVETEVRLRAWRRSMKEKGDDLQERIERQRLEAEAIGKFSKEEGVRGAPRGSSFSSKKRTLERVHSSVNEADVLAFLNSMDVD